MTEVNLSTQRVLVTGGAGQGIGSGICQALYQAGATLIINDIDQHNLDLAAEKYPTALTINANIKNQIDIDRMFAEMDVFCGGINGLVNNAGIGLGKDAHEASEAEFDNLFNVDVKAVWQLSKKFVNECLARKELGNIVNISSVHVFATQAKYAIYSSAKNAVAGLTRGMACEVGPLGFRVNAVGPGLVHADQNLELIKVWSDDPEQWVKDFIQNQQVLNYDIMPLDIGNTVAFLLSDLARCITGQNIYVDNGTTCLIFNRDFT